MTQQETQQQPAFRYLPTIAGLFVAALIITNTIDSKLFGAFGLTLTVGIVIFPLSYLLGDVLTEVYGYSVTRRVIWTGFISLLLMLIIYEIARRMPGIPEWTDQEAFDAIFGRVPRITIASMLAYAAGEFVNSYVVAKMKIWTRGKMMSLRFIASTMAGQFFDTIIFVGIAFIGAVPLAVLPAIAVSSWIVKVGWEIVALPITLVVVRWLKHAEHVDFYDRETNFNPFKIGA